ncbi:MAG: glycoside hydrolase family 32 protein, partial [Flavobacteriaceae bacterium]
GSAVVDENNTSGLGKDGKVPLVALFTYFRMDVETKGGTTTQKQGLAYSLDNGVTWTKYPGNPIIDNTDLKDFRDPKVFWHEGTQRWIMALVAGDHVKFYRSQDLIQWTKVSEFGRDHGAHGGVWECPDLFPLKVEGNQGEKWVLIISIGTGGPNGGSGTQYFVGDFDGSTFTTDQEEIKWLDWGADNYAGVTYNHTPDGERVFIGWMSNWGYALNTPTQTWRSAMTLPRRLSLGKKDGEYFLRNYPVNAVNDLAETVDGKELQIPAQGTVSVADEALNQSKISFTTKNRDFKLTFSNALGEQLNLIFDSTSKLVILDRTASGKTGFEKTFGGYLHYMVMPETLGSELEGTIFMDSSSLELFINGGRYVMTEQVFPSQPYTQLTIDNMSHDGMEVREFSIVRMEGIWKR